MSHIFLSYASADRERARQIADLLSDFGWKVWWDRTIPPGRQFDEVIEEALDAAGCVVVLWSKASIASNWVKTEAAEANRRKILIPVQIENVKIPLEFRRVQAADLAGWNGERSSPDVDKLVAAIESELPRSGSARIAEQGAMGAIAEPSPPPPSATSWSEPVEPPPEPAPQPPPQPPSKNSAPASSGVSAAHKWVAASAFVALLAGGFFWYQSVEQSRQREFQVERQRQELERRLEEERRNAEAERARQEKEAADQASRERAARDAAERDAAARRRAADEAAANERKRQTDEASARRPTEAAPSRGSNATLTLTWRDHALTYSGNVSVDGSSAKLFAAINDLNTGQLIGRYTVPARVSGRGQNEYFVQAEFAIPGDSATPYPHSHQVGLVVRQQSDGTLRVVQNCPAPGVCY